MPENDQLLVNISFFLDNLNNQKFFNLRTDNEQIMI